MHPPPSVAFAVLSPCYCIVSTPPLPVQISVHLDVAFTHQPSDSPACLCTPRRMPASSVKYRDCTLPPFSSLVLLPVPCRLLGSSTPVGPSAALCPCPTLPERSDISRKLLVFGSMSGFFSRDFKGPGFPTPCQLPALVLAPPDTWPFGRRSGYPDTSPFPPLPPPLFALIPSPLIETDWCSYRPTFR